MIQLSSIRKNTKRVGRGGKRGTTAGRGTKGQKSRSGHVIRPAERDLILKFPKQRGFRNKPTTPTAKVFNLDDLSKALTGHKENAKINQEFLKAAGLLGKKFRGPVKILGGGEMKAVVIIGSDIQVSKSAESKIISAGGKVAR